MSSEHPPERILLRRLTKDTWRQTDNAPLRASFKRRKSEASLSVYDSSLCSPRDVLQSAINNALRQCQGTEDNERGKGEDFLDKHGDNVEKLIENGWRVARISESAFTSRGFEVSAPDNAGHCDVTSEMDIFETYRDELAREATLVPMSDYAETL